MLEFKRAKGEQLSEVGTIISTYNPTAVIQRRYYIVIEDGIIKGCVGLIRRAWFMTEIKHLYVKEQYRGQGIGTFLVSKALKRIKSPLACCTVKADNLASLRVFQHFRFTPRERFVNQDTGNRVMLLTRKM
jgi:GNAT superfamily N-acetyltransferase